MIVSRTLKALGFAAGLMLASGAMAAGPYDGVYVGSQRVTKTNNSSQCQRINQDNLKVMVMNSTIRYRWGPVPLETTVASDGSFSEDAGGSASRGYSSAVSFKGKITGTNLEADVGGNVCAGHLSMRKE